MSMKIVMGLSILTFLLLVLAYFGVFAFPRTVSTYKRWCEGMRSKVVMPRASAERFTGPWMFEKTIANYTNPKDQKETVAKFSRWNKNNEHHPNPIDTAKLLNIDLG